MRILKVLLVLCCASLVILTVTVTVRVHGEVALPVAPPPTEAPAGFDNLTNGLVDQATFDGDSVQFSEVEGISFGIGPTYNATSCRECHQNPVVGGISQIKELRAGHLDQSGNFVPATVHLASGEVVANRSLINQRAICPEAQEHVEPGENIHATRTSLNVLGDGFVESIADSTLTDLAQQQCQKSGGRICGEAIHVPVSELDGATAVGRFGWKDQQASLLSFAADAYINEMGVSNRLQPHDFVKTCKTTTDPENTDPKGPGFEDIDSFAEFMRSTKAPPRDPVLSKTALAIQGEHIFHQLGCDICHVSTFTTAPAGTVVDGGAFTVPDKLGNKTIHPFSDFLLHNVGTGDGIVQNGGPESAHKLRTPPLWGLRTRNEMMHDGGSLTYNDAILRHGGEARHVIGEFRELTRSQREALYNFLKSL